jgi:hypothetical protein
VSGSEPSPQNPGGASVHGLRFDYECAFCGGEGNADERCSGMITEPDHPSSVKMVPKGTRPGSVKP